VGATVGAGSPVGELAGESDSLEAASPSAAASASAAGLSGAIGFFGFKKLARSI
jgi:hypothetical protein